MAENLRDTHHGKVLRVDDSVAPGGAHALSAHAKEFKCI
jgi:hypothetical protein